MPVALPKTERRDVCDRVVNSGSSGHNEAMDEQAHIDDPPSPTYSIAQHFKPRAVMEEEEDDLYGGAHNADDTPPAFDAATNGEDAPTKHEDDDADMDEDEDEDDDDSESVQTLLRFRNRGR